MIDIISFVFSKIDLMNCRLSDDEIIKKFWDEMWSSLNVKLSFAYEFCNEIV
jgi:uncharacterized ubiquitin-like protein YukD